MDDIGHTDIKVHRLIDIQTTQRSKGIRQWPINVSTSPMVIHKITFFRLVVEMFGHSI